ncbi:hypothetical protein [Spongiactinospora sp. TRM90649]|uniref:hypothetical protein n=1 Tax=Spongiactinospora sp. TRM90649 TaxID=3031114 RepID=UPI0023F88858|nr:hypothetical protein [Spongiactinospora sp. TRM90649]MDF5757280.1 hypothetical protein [Spongiactinospora sp. TRM90649]
MTTGAAGEEAPPALRKVIGRQMLLLFVVGDILGAGIHALVGKVAGHVGGALGLPFVVAWRSALRPAGR